MTSLDRHPLSLKCPPSCAEGRVMIGAGWFEWVCAWVRFGGAGPDERQSACSRGPVGLGKGILGPESEAPNRCCARPDSGVTPPSGRTRARLSGRRGPAFGEAIPSGSDGLCALLSLGGRPRIPVANLQTTAGHATGSRCLRRGGGGVQVRCSVTHFMWVLTCIAWDGGASDVWVAQVNAVAYRRRTAALSCWCPGRRSSSRCIVLQHDGRRPLPSPLPRLLRTASCAQ